MANYEYIIASLPSISRDWKFGEDKSLDTYLQWIKSQLSAKDIKTVDTLLDGFKEENLNQDFYEAVLKDGNRFIREYFAFDLNLRNMKARFLNRVSELLATVFRWDNVEAHFDRVIDVLMPGKRVLMPSYGRKSAS